MAKKTQGGRTLLQIAIVVPDIDEAMRKYYEKLDIGPWEVYTFAPPNLRESFYKGKPSDAEWVLALAWLGDRQLELMQPLKGESVISEFLRKKGSGIHHIKEVVDDCRETLERYRKKGLEVVQCGKYDEDEFYYLSTEPELGIIYEVGNAGKIRAPERTYP